MNSWLFRQKHRARHRYVFSVCVLTRRRNNDGGTNKHTLVPNLWVLKSIFQSSWRNGWFRAKARKTQDEPGIVCSAPKKSAQKLCQKYSRDHLKGLPVAIAGITRARTYIIIIHKIKIKIPRVHSDVTFKNEWINWEQGNVPYNWIPTSKCRKNDGIGIRKPPQ